jgi:RNA polymerase sigma-70 factor (ECF subfamily)
MSPTDLWRGFVRAPSEDSFRPFYEATKGLVWTIALRVVREPTEASDAFQGAYARLLEFSRDTTASEAIEDVGALVARLSVREADRMKKRRDRRSTRERSYEESSGVDGIDRNSAKRGVSDGPDPAEVAARRELSERLERTIDRLPDTYRIPLVLHYFHGLSFRQIADALELPLATVAHRHRRALEKLDAPLRRAGLGRATVTLAGTAAGAALIEPQLGAATVYAAVNVASTSAALSGSLVGSMAVTRVFGASVLMSSYTKAAVAAFSILVLSATAWWFAQSNEAAVVPGNSKDGALVETVAPSPSSGDASASIAAPAPIETGAPASAARADSIVARAVWIDSEEPIVGASITIESLGERPSTIARGETDATGTCVFEAPSFRGKVRVEASHAESLPTATEIDLPASGSVALRLARDVVLGRVTDALTGEPIEGAVVRIDDFARSGPSAMTDRDGAYRLARPGEGTLRLVASFEDRADSTALVEHAAPSVSIRDFALSLGATVTVLVTDDNGVPLEGARATPSLHGMEGVFYTDLGVDTDARGEARLERVHRTKPPNIQVAKDGYETVYARPPIGPVDTASELRVALPRIVERRCVIAGRVTDEKGRPIAGARIEWKDGAGTRYADDEPYGAIHALSDARGDYRLEFTDDHEYCHLGVAAPGRAPLVERNVRPGTPEEPLQRDFVLEPGHWLAGTVVDELGRPLGGVRVQAMPDISISNEGVAYPAVLRSTETDAEGRFRLDDLSGPTTAITLRTSGRPSHEAEVEVDREVELVFPGWGSIRGVVVDQETQEPIEAFTVRIRSSPNGVSVDDAEIGRSFTSLEGRFTLDRLDPGGPYGVQILADGYPGRLFEAIVASPESSEDERVFALSLGRRLEGSIVDPVTGLGLAGVRVQASASEIADGIVPRDWDPYRRLLDVLVTTTDDAGRFSFVETDPLRLLVSSPGRRTVFVPPPERARYDDGTGKLRIPVERGERLEGIVGPEDRPKSGVEVVIERIVAVSDDAHSEPRVERHGVRTSDARGRVVWDDLEPGDYRLVISQRPGEPTPTFEVGTRREVRVVEGEPTLVELGGEPGPVTLRGAIDGMDDKSSVWVEISLRRESNPAAEELYFKTYAEWEWRWVCPGLIEGTYRATATYYTPAGPRRVELRALDVREGTTPVIRVPSER